MLPHAAPRAPTVALLLGVGLLAVLLVQIAVGYHVVAFRTFGRQAVRIGFAWSATFGAVALLLPLLGIDVGRHGWSGWLWAWYAAGLVMLLGFRLGLASIVRRWARDGRLERRAVIVGGGGPAAALIEALHATPGNDVRVCGIFDDRGDARSPASIAGYPKLGTVAQLVEFGRLARVDLLVITLPISAEARVADILRQLWILPVDIRLAAHTRELRFRPRTSHLGSLPLLDVMDRPIADWDGLAKRAFDLVVGLLLLVLLSPVLLAVAAAIKLDSRGPVLFRQKRYGFNNRIVDVLKFRSLKHEHSDPLARRPVTRDDDRVTRVGRFIRRTSLDELPQLVNVVRGDLSLVGPRPHAVGAHTQERLFESLVDGYFARHRVKPGVTGWAQINGWRGEIDAPEKILKRVEYDLQYIENWSIMFDLWILLRTPFALLKGENAF
jgi:Undecaprenyl-phosphate glucose phosphotransferase